MIIYVTKDTAERYKLKMPEDMTSPLKEVAASFIEKQQGDKLLEWGAKIFYFDRRKCLQVVNFASKLALFLVDVKVDDLLSVGSTMADYISDLYKDSREMQIYLKRLFEEDGFVVFSALKDKSIISTLNRNQSDYADDGYRLYEFIENGILQTRKFNQNFNREWPVSRKVEGKKEYFYPADIFEQLLKERYSK